MALQTNRVIEGDSLNELTSLPDDSVHAIVTDPPYGLNFMPGTTNGWDDFEPKEYQDWCEEWATKALRVLKPGGHLLAFSGNRTHHRLFAGVEDAGFIVRDTLTWHYGSGFPKGQDVGKLIDKQAYKQRHDIQEFQKYLEKCRKGEGLSTAEVAKHFADEGQNPTGCVWNWENVSLPEWGHYQELKDILGLDDRFDELMRKESAEREVIGAGDAGLSSGYSRETESHEVGFSDEYNITAPSTDEAEQWDGWSTQLKPSTEFVVMARKPLSEGTIAENVLEHGTAALNIDGCRIESDGSHKRQYQPTNNDRNVYGEQDGFKPTNADGRYPANLLLDDVAANGLEESRYFYCAKADKRERTLNGRIDNTHPTVKPIDLMEWLVKLVTAEGQIVLDPFAGSGTTLRAAKNLNREFVGIEQQSKWCDVARARCGLTPENPEVLTSENQSALSSYGDV